MFPRSIARAHARRRAFSLIEAMVVLAIITVATGMLARTLASAAKLDPVATETAIAASGARTMIEQMKNHEFSELFALYNDVPGDDPGGPGTAPGAHFAIQGLVPLTAGGLVGTIVFPSIDGQLREDVVDDELGMPRDLNADSLVDSTNHANDCVLLPIRIRVEWTSRAGRDAKRKFEMFTMFARF